MTENAHMQVCSTPCWIWWTLSKLHLDRNLSIELRTKT